MIEIVKEIDKSIKATDFKHDSFVQVAMNDGSFFLWKQAFIQNIENNEQWLVIFTEHYGYFLFDCDDVAVKDTNDQR